MVRVLPEAGAASLNHCAKLAVLAMPKLDPAVPLYVPVGSREHGFQAVGVKIGFAPALGWHS